MFIKVFRLIFVELSLTVNFLQATCNPVAYSLLSDHFSSGGRATVLSIYHIGVYIGKKFCAVHKCLYGYTIRVPLL